MKRRLQFGSSNNVNVPMRRFGPFWQFFQPMIYAQEIIIEIIYFMFPYLNLH